MAKRQKRETCYMERLPSDLKLKIIENLSGRDLLTLECVSKEWRRLLPADEYWKKLCYADDRWREIWKEMLYSGDLLEKLKSDYKLWCRLVLGQSSWKRLSDDLKAERDRCNWKEMPNGWNSWKEVFSLWNIVRGDEDVYTLCLSCRQFYDMERFSSVITFARLRLPSC